MGVTAENLSEQFGISKEQQNEVAYQSQLNATAAIKDGRFKDEIVPVVIPQRKGDPKVVDTDECPRETTPEILAGLKPVFKKDGVVTAGNASAIADGASAVVVTSRKKAAELGLKPIAQLVSYATAAVRARHHGPRRDQGRTAGAREGRPDQQGRPAGRAQRGLRLRRRARHPRARARSRTSSTSTAARWRSATRSATPARA